MPNKRSALKELRKTRKRREHNQRTKSQLKFLLNKTRALIKAGNKSEALESIKLYQKAVDKAAKIGVLKMNNAGRKKSSIMKAVSKTA